MQIIIQARVPEDRRAALEALLRALIERTTGRVVSRIVYR